MIKCLIILFLFFSCNNDNNLIGKWRGESEFLLDGSDTLNLSNSDKLDYKLNDILVFNYDGTGVLNSDDTFKYNLEGDNLKMGNREYQLVILNDSILVLEESTMLGAFTIHKRFKRVK